MPCLCTVLNFEVFSFLHYNVKMFTRETSSTLGNVWKHAGTTLTVIDTMQTISAPLKTCFWTRGATKSTGFLNCRGTPPATTVGITINRWLFSRTYEARLTPADSQTGLKRTRHTGLDLSDRGGKRPLKVRQCGSDFNLCIGIEPSRAFRLLAESHAVTRGFVLFQTDRHIIVLYLVVHEKHWLVQVLSCETVILTEIQTKLVWPKLPILLVTL